MKTESHVIHLATPNILAFKLSQCRDTEDEITVQIAKLTFVQYDEDNPQKGIREIHSVPIDETGYFEECFNDEDYILLGKPGDTISRYDSRLLSLHYGWKKSKEHPGMTELESALTKKGLVIDTALPPCLSLTIHMDKEEDCFAFHSPSPHIENNLIGFKCYVLFDDTLDENNRLLPDYRFNNEWFAGRILNRIQKIADVIPVPRIEIDLRLCEFLGIKPISELLPGYNLKETISYLKAQDTPYEITIKPDSTNL